MLLSRAGWGVDTEGLSQTRQVLAALAPQEDLPRPRLEQSALPLFGSVPLHRVGIARHPRAALPPPKSLPRVARVPVVTLSCRSKNRGQPGQAYRARGGMITERVRAYATWHPRQARYELVGAGQGNRVQPDLLRRRRIGQEPKDTRGLLRPPRRGSRAQQSREGSIAPIVGLRSRAPELVSYLPLPRTL
jgi:hypothetical protein